MILMPLPQQQTTQSLNLPYCKLSASDILMFNEKSHKRKTKPDITVFPSVMPSPFLILLLFNHSLPQYVISSAANSSGECHCALMLSAVMWDFIT